MKKGVLTIIMALLVGIAQAIATDYVYVNGSSVNFRQSPNTGGKKISALFKGEVLQYIDTTPDGEWFKVTAEIFNEISMNTEKHTGYVSSRYCTRIVTSPVTPDVLGGFQLLQTNDDVAGYLEFEKKGSGAYSYMLRIVSREMQAAGGTGTLDFQSGEVKLNGGELQSVNGNPSVYDAPARLLYFAGYLWTSDK